MLGDLRPVNPNPNPSPDPNPNPKPNPNPNPNPNPSPDPNPNPNADPDANPKPNADPNPNPNPNQVEAFRGLGFLERGLTAWQAMQAEAAVLRDARPRLAMRGGARKHRLADQ